jgi:hypothetical protein
VVERGDEVFPGVEEYLPHAVQFALWSFLGVGLVISAVVAVIVQRQQVAIERSWKRIHDKAKRWQEGTMSTLKSDLQETETRLAQRNVQVALEEVETRLQRLRDLERAVESKHHAPPDVDPVIDERIAPSISPAPQLTALEVNEIVNTFRRGRYDDPAFRDDPERIIEGLYRDAASVAGDPEPLLHREVRHLEESLRRAVPPMGAIRTPPFAPDVEHNNNYAHAASFLAVPAPIATYLSSDDVVCHGIPVEDRFYAIVVESGMNARHVLGQHGARLRDLERSPDTRELEQTREMDLRSLTSIDSAEHVDESPGQDDWFMGNSDEGIQDPGLVASVPVEIAAHESGEQD